jgi:tetratricopeptide (TPR) repeat protein/CHAT domain-containing protein
MSQTPPIEDLLEQGDKLHNVGQFAEAFQIFDEVHQLQPDSLRALTGRANCLWSIGKYDEALTEYNKVLELDPDYVSALNGRGNVLKDLGKYEDAIADYSKAIELQPTYFYAWNGRGNALVCLGRNEEALADYNQSIALNPSYFGAWRNRGNTFYNLGRYEEAVADHTKSLDLKPDYYLTWWNRGNALHELKRYTEAVSDHSKAIELNSTDYCLWRNRGNALYELGRYDESVANYSKAIDLNPNYYLIWWNRGNAFKQLGRYQEAIADYTQTINLNPNFASAWNTKGVALYSIKSYQESLDNYDRAIEVSTNYFCCPHVGRGNVFHDMKQYEEAIAEYTKVTELQPQCRWSWNNRGNSLRNLRRYEEAIADYKKALELTQNQCWLAWENLGWALCDSQGYKAAQETWSQAIQKLVRRQPVDDYLKGCANLWRTKGIAYRQEARLKGNPLPFWRDAKRCFGKSLGFFKECLEVSSSNLDLREQFLTVLQDYITVCRYLRGDSSKIQRLLEEGTDSLSRLLSDPGYSKASKERLALKFVGFDQLTVDMSVQNGQLKDALETAEKGKNACLTWLLYAWSDDIASPSYETIQQLLTPTTAIVYWHLSPAALTTFVLKSGEPAPILISTPLSQCEQPESLQRLLKFEAWMQDWDRQYQDYRSKGKKHPNTDHSWRKDMQQRLFERQEEPGNLKNILNIEAIEQHLDGITQLILIPHRDLHRFPLHALFSPRFTIAYLPSSQVGITLQQRQPSSTNRLLSIENPDGTLGFARVEAEGIYQHFSQLESIQENHATKEQVEVALNGDFSVFHFAGHAEHVPSDPRKSRLILANQSDVPSNQDELSQSLTNNWTIEDLCQHDFSSYDLITLSACETALTNNQTITTEYVGLVSGFLRNGAAQVVSTLWTVESAASALVMIEFYRRRQLHKSDAAALAEAVDLLKNFTVADLKQWCNNFLAQLPADFPQERKKKIKRTLDMELYRWDKIESDQKIYSDPYYWAAFAIAGRFS